MAERVDGTWERSIRKGLYRRLTLRRADGQVYLNRWGVGHDRVGRVLLHKMEAPDPGVDLHDHPWWFVSIVLWGGYTEQRADIRERRGSPASPRSTSRDAAAVSSTSAIPARFGSCG